MLRDVSGILETNSFFEYSSISNFTSCFSFVVHHLVGLSRENVGLVGLLFSDHM